MRLSGRRGRRGSALMEFALIAPVLLLLTFGAMDFARVFRTAQGNANAARAAVQFGAISEANANDCTGIQEAARTDAGNPSMTVTSSTFCTCSIGGEEQPCTTSCSGKMTYLRVETQSSYTPVIKYPGLGSTFTLRNRAVRRIQ